MASKTRRAGSIPVGGIEMMAKKPKGAGGGERLKLDVSWEEAAERLLRTQAKSTPPRAVKPRQKKTQKPKP